MFKYVSNGADINSIDIYNNTPFSLSFNSHSDMWFIVFLIENGAIVKEESLKNIKNIIDNKPDYENDILRSFGISV